jgi:hypothetical protein
MMAIYHFHAETVNKNSGRSAAGGSSYIQRRGAFKCRANELLHSSSAHMPWWAQGNSLHYWELADKHERANGRLYKEVEFSLPRELILEQNVKLATEFAEHLTSRLSLPYTLAIHDDGAWHNPHCHIMINERVNDGVDRPAEMWFRRHDSANPGERGAPKTEKLKPKKWLRQARADWAGICNKHLRQHGIDERIDCRSLVDQGILHRIPSTHIGPTAKAMEKNGKTTERMSKYEKVVLANEIIMGSERGEEKQIEREFEQGRERFRER